MKSYNIRVRINELVVKNLALDIFIYAAVLVDELDSVNVSILCALRLVYNSKRPLSKLLDRSIPYPGAGQDIVAVHNTPLRGAACTPKGTGAQTRFKDKIF